MKLQRLHIRLAFLICAPMLVSLPGRGEQKPVVTGNGLVPVTLLWDAHASGEDSVDQNSFAELVGSMGFQISRLAVGDLQKTRLDRTGLLLLPHASAQALTPELARSIRDNVRDGLRLITDGESPMTRALGIRLDQVEMASAVIDRNLTDIRLHWADKPSVRWIARAMVRAFQFLYADSATGHPLAIAASLGRGRFIYLAPLLDPISGHGYSRFPTLVNSIVHQLHCTPPFRRNAVDAYFDPGYRAGFPLDKLAALWRRQGIHALHAAAWYTNINPAYDYKALIEAAHRNGIRVYAWLEWPHMGRGFWDKHPEWREKNALLQDAKLDFLHLMDLQNPDCLNAALEELGHQMELDWDGVDVAEFTITGAGGEALDGPASPEHFVSFGPPMRSEFKKAAGFDPLELENPQSQHFWERDSAGLEKFYQYRTTVNNRLLRRVIGFLDSLRNSGKRDWELIHTIVDNSLHPEFDHLLGFDQKSTLGLLREYNVTLNVEDPYMEWANPPDRYLRLRKTLNSLVPERPSMIDINVVPVHPDDQEGFPSAQATGTEILQQARSAAGQQGRVCFYCESTVHADDWRLIPYAMAIGAAVEKGGKHLLVKTPHTVMLRAGPDRARVTLNEKPWPCNGIDGIIVPAGSHIIDIHLGLESDKSGPPKIILNGISDELLAAETREDGIELQYSSPARCLLSFNKQPSKLLIDGTEAEAEILSGANGYVVLAPSGQHRLRVMAQ